MLEGWLAQRQVCLRCHARHCQSGWVPVGSRASLVEPVGRGRYVGIAL